MLTTVANRLQVEFVTRYKCMIDLTDIYIRNLVFPF